MREHYIYKITFETGEFYIGVRTSPIGLTAEQDSRYVGSPGKANWWRWQKLKYIKQVLAKRATREEANWLEERLILLAKRLYGARCINMHANKRWCTYGFRHTSQTKAKLSKIKLGNTCKLHSKLSLESRQRMSLATTKALLGKRHTESAKKNMSKAAKGRKYNKPTGKQTAEPILFTHKDGRQYLAPIGSTTGTIAKAIGCKYGSVYYLFAGKTKSAAGWHISH